MIHTIYKSVNTKNGKVYIGFDSNWPNRMAVHKSASKKQNYKFYRAIRKYGWDSFEWSVIYQSQDKEHTLNVMETFFIKEYDSFHNGYNSTLGGDGCFGLVLSKDAKKRIKYRHIHVRYVDGEGNDALKGNITTRKRKKRKGKG